MEELPEVVSCGLSGVPGEFLEQVVWHISMASPSAGTLFTAPVKALEKPQNREGQSGLYSVVVRRWQGVWSRR